MPLRGKMDERHGVTAVLRAAQSRGCASCDDVMKRGWEAGEFFDAGLFIYARCAHEKGELELALRVLDQLSFEHEFERWARSPMHVVLAYFERARILEQLGRKDEARAAWQQASRFWRNADRPRPEVKEAREALERLK